MGKLHDMLRAVDMTKAAVVLTVIAVCVQGLHHTINIGAILPSNCSLTNDCPDQPQYVISVVDSESASIELSTIYVNPKDIFQLSMCAKNLSQKNFNIVLVDERLRSSFTVTTTSAHGSSPIFLPSMFWLKDTRVFSAITNVHHLACCSGLRDPVSCRGGLKTNVTKTCLSPPSPTRILRTLFCHLNWTEVVLIYDESNEQEAFSLSTRLEDTQILTYKLDPGGVLPTARESPREVPNSAKRSPRRHTRGKTGSKVLLRMDKMIMDLLETLYAKVPLETNINVVLMCDAHSIKRILSMANRFDREHGKGMALHIRSKWLVSVLGQSPNVISDVREFLETLDHLDNIAVVHTAELVPHIQTFNTTTGELIKEGVSQLSEKNVTVTSDTLSEAITELIQSADDDCVETTVSSVYFGGQNGRYLNNVARVTSSNGVVLFGKNGVFPNALFGLNKRVLDVSTLEWQPFMIKQSPTEYDGYCMDLLVQLELVLNFTHRWIDPPEAEWGTRLANGSFTGLVGQLQRQEVDMVVAPLAMHTEREEVMDFVFPFFTDYTTVLLKMPDPDETKWLTLIRPFKWEVHLTIWVAMFSVAVFGTLLERRNPYYGFKTEKSSLYCLSDCVWYMYGALLTQGGEKLPNSMTGRTVVSYWWLFSIIVASTYGGNLIAFLTVSKDILPFNSVQGLLDQDRYKWGTVGGSIYETIFEQSVDPVKVSLWEELKSFNRSDPSVLSHNPADHLNKVKGGDYAYIGDKSMIDVWKNKECDLVTIKEKFFPIQYAIGVVNNSAYKKLLSDEMIKINELGLFHMWGTRWWAKQRFCQGSLITEATAISLLDVQSAFYVMAIGVVLSALVLGVEKLRRYITEWRESKRYNIDATRTIHNNLTLRDASAVYRETRQRKNQDVNSNTNLPKKNSLKRTFSRESSKNRNMYLADGAMSRDFTFSSETGQERNGNVFTLDIGSLSSNTHAKKYVYNKERRRDSGFSDSKTAQAGIRANHQRLYSTRNTRKSPRFLPRLSLPDVFPTESSDDTPD